MEAGRLYFIKDEFYERFTGCGILENKEVIGSIIRHKRLCCYMFKYDTKDNIYWMLSIPSKVAKYKKQYQHSMEKYHMCDNISFGYVLGEERAFLPQNLFPITEKYIGDVYIDKNTLLPISIPANLMSELNAKARKKIRYNMQGKYFGMTDVMKIYNELIKDIQIACEQ